MGRKNNKSRNQWTDMHAHTHTQKERLSVKERKIPARETEWLEKNKIWITDIMSERTH